ncbi:metaxin-1 [Dendroctonus ponderosae]|uniref:Uncharacterized protein n=1 Tax=Dendroctonus ponderosae TaxID=77166 RepID=U4ULN1_DENPD|nr:metaxin-1 [Dendroctonus ponderosae]ERL91096.1 hypothetical protein D910_08438 [Dendroctonus ponderosae]
MLGNDKFTLYVYDGDYGLPSFNVECTKVLLYIAMVKVSVEIKTLNNIKSCAFYTGPCFMHKNLSFGSFGDIVPYLNTLNFDLDVQLSPKQRSEALALSNMVQAKLRGPVEFAFWVDSRNFEEFTRVWFAKALPLPFNILLSRQFKENAVNLVESMCPNDSCMELVKEYFNSLARECLASLSARLGVSEYFFGDQPSSLDVVVYSYVAPLVKLPFPSNDLSIVVALWPNLVSFINRIDAKFLPELPKESKYIKNEAKLKTSDDEVSYVAISILTVSAISLLWGFAVSKGFISSKLF